MRFVFGAFLGTAVVVLVAACGDRPTADRAAADRGAEVRGARIDEIAGTYAGVGIGDTRTKMFRALGPRRAGGDEKVTPLASGENDFGPVTVLFPPSMVRRPVELSFYRYRYVVFLFVDARMQVFSVVEPGAATNRGVRIGDPLEKVRTRYPELRCAIAREGTEYGPKFPACSGRVAKGRSIWFGGDPVGDVTVGNARFGF